MKRLDVVEQAQAIKAAKEANEAKLAEIHTLLTALAESPTLVELVAFLKAVRELFEEVTE